MRLSSQGKTGSRLFTEVKALLDGVDIWMSDHLDNLPVLFTLGSQAGVVDINHAFHLYYCISCITAKMDVY